MLVGDLNVWFDDPTIAVSTFLEAAQEVEMEVLLTGPTHHLDHALDAVLFRDLKIELACVNEVQWSDHFVIGFKTILLVNTPRPIIGNNKTTFRNFKDFLMEKVCQVLSSQLTTLLAQNKESVYQCIHDSIGQALDTVAPLQVKKANSLRRTVSAAWFTLALN